MGRLAADSSSLKFTYRLSAALVVELGRVLRQPPMLGSPAYVDSDVCFGPPGCPPTRKALSVGRAPPPSPPPLPRCWQCFSGEIVAERASGTERTVISAAFPRPLMSLPLPGHREPPVW
ncbi:hypothetical protein V5799_017613 [Amblyomma americanum]|uniref:Uncharacterized protein n=1 Tax=Amblyomma americanum TaxID=6943 RepID=A0AAQ4F1P9_AMBAM